MILSVVSRITVSGDGTLFCVCLHLKMKLPKTHTMRKSKKIIKIIKTGILIICISINGYANAQKQFIITSSKANNYCNGNCTTLDVPDLNNNPTAIMWVTPILVDGRNINTHPIGAYYFESRWRIFNIDQATMPVGAKFKVEYIVSADQDHFKYIVTDNLLQKDGSALIDNPALNNNPNALFNYFLNWNPAEQKGTNNRNEIKIDYNPDAGKWYISNVNKKALYRGDAYNIIISSDSDIRDRSSGSYKAVQISELTTTAKSTSTAGAVTLMYMIVWADGIKLPGENIRNAHFDKTQIFAYEMGVTNPYKSSQLSTKRLYEPITVKSHTGFPLTIPLFNAFVKNQDITITIETYTTSAAGVEELNYSINLTGASIVSFKQVYEELGLHKGDATKKYYDEIKIIFKKIEFFKDKSLSVTDNGL